MFFQKVRDNLVYADFVADHIDILGLFTPMNIEEEMEKWLASPGKKYCPQFVYDEPAILQALNRAKKLRSALPRIAEYYADDSDWRALLTHDLLVSQYADVDATISLLRAFAKNGVIEHDCAETATNHLFGEVTKDEYNLAVRIVYEPADQVLKEHLIGENERHLYSQEKLESIIHNYLHDFKGILTHDEFEALRSKDINKSQLEAVLEEVARYLIDHGAGEQLISVRLLNVLMTDHFGILSRAPLPFHYEISIPYDLRKLHDGKLSACNLLQVIAHEINSHLRVMISTEMLTSQISPHFHHNLIMRNPCNLSQEGFAVLNGESCIEEIDGDMFEPLTIVIPDYVRAGHNFTEAAEHLYAVCDIDPDMDYRPIHRVFWTILQSFFGMKDTSAHVGYSFPYHQIYTLGAFRTLKELVRVDQNYFEDPLSLMRYSELPLNMMRRINHIEHDLGRKLAPDPFELWDFANFHPDIPTPTDYAKQLLLAL